MGVLQLRATGTHDVHKGTAAKGDRHDGHQGTTATGDRHDGTTRPGLGYSGLKIYAGDKRGWGDGKDGRMGGVCHQYGVGEAGTGVAVVDGRDVRGGENVLNSGYGERRRAVDCPDLDLGQVRHSDVGTKQRPGSHRVVVRVPAPPHVV